MYLLRPVAAGAAVGLFAVGAHALLTGGPGDVPPPQPDLAGFTVRVPVSGPQVVVPAEPVAGDGAGEVAGDRAGVLDGFGACVAAELADTGLVDDRALFDAQQACASLLTAP